MNKKFLVYFKNGLHNPITIEAEDEHAAAVEGLAAFRKDVYFVDFRPLDQVIDRISEC